MSEQDAVEKLKWYRKQAMESPLNSPQRITWIEICRDIEALIKRMTTVSAAAIVNDFELDWNFTG